MKLIELDKAPVKSLLPILLSDKTTKRNIIFATDAYKEYGFNEKNQITVEDVEALKTVIQPRVSKTLEAQATRTRTKAEVFTPSWIVNKMNNHCDEEWENLNFLLSYYNQNFLTFTKWNISLQELQKICDFYGENFDVSTLKNPQYYIFKRGKYEISIGNEGYYDALHKGNLFVLYISNTELIKQVQKKYDSFE